MKQRIWELDALRGFLLIGMIGIHLIFDLVDLYGILPWQLPHWYELFKNNYGASFMVLSGLSATLGRRPIKRGLQVFLSGFLCTAATWGMYRMGAADKSLIIYFGVLHCLGMCMMLWAVFGKLPTHWLVVLGLIFWGAGIYLRSCAFSFSWLTFVGFAPYGFASSDYFPLLPNFGYFLLGAALGRKLYASRKSLLPEKQSALPGLQWLGRNSLLIYLLHQPILAGLCALIAYT